MYEFRYTTSSKRFMDIDCGNIIKVAFRILEICTILMRKIKILFIPKIPVKHCIILVCSSINDNILIHISSFKRLCNDQKGKRQAHKVGIFGLFTLSNKTLYLYTHNVWTMLRTLLKYMHWSFNSGIKNFLSDTT